MPVQLSVNYSPALLQLLAAGAIDVDVIKISVNPDAAEQITTALRFRPLLLHGLA